jgi:ActR/RegA family two-component response regulator
MPVLSGRERRAKAVTPVDTGHEHVESTEKPPLPEPSGRPAPGEASESILCVDDDPNILAALQRQFRKTFRIVTATGPEEGLAAIDGKGPFAVVVSDLRMPGMSGIQFLTAVRALAPDTVRVMLTGQADMADAIAAVNQGAIFRFLLKPSSAIILGKVIEAALEQHRLIVAERQLTQQTLVGCVEVLAEVLSIVEPAAFSRTTRVLRRFHEHPAAAARIIERIPRLETVAQIVEAQFAPCRKMGPDSEPGAPRDAVHFGAAILQAALDFDERRRRGLSHAAALADMRLRVDHYRSDVMSALARVEEVELAEQTRVVPVSRLAPGMVLEQDICARNGICLVAKGQQITPTLLERLQGFAHAQDTDLTVSVRIPDV